MKLTATQLRRIIKEEAEKQMANQMMDEGEFDITSKDLVDEDSKWKKVVVYAESGKVVKTFTNKTVDEVASKLKLDGAAGEPGGLEIGVNFEATIVTFDSGLRLAVVGTDKDTNQGAGLDAALGLT